MKKIIKLTDNDLKLITASNAVAAKQLPWLTEFVKDINTVETFFRQILSQHCGGGSGTGGGGLMGINGGGGGGGGMPMSGGGGMPMSGAGSGT